jgi:hypothetical protein
MGTSVWVLYLGVLLEKQHLQLVMEPSRGSLLFLIALAGRVEAQPILMSQYCQVFFLKTSTPCLAVFL